MKYKARYIVRYVWTVEAESPEEALEEAREAFECGMATRGAYDIYIDGEEAIMSCGSLRECNNAEGCQDCEVDREV
jgi:hypothetical protein